MSQTFSFLLGSQVCPVNYNILIIIEKVGWYRTRLKTPRAEENYMGVLRAPAAFQSAKLHWKKSYELGDLI